MSKRDRTLVCALLLCGLFILSLGATADKGGEVGNSCVQCHFRLPGDSFIGAESHSWTGSIHQKSGVTCDKCHGGNPQAAEEKEAHQGVLPSGNPQSTVYFKNVPATCGKCHGAQFYKFTQSVHYRMLESTGRRSTPRLLDRSPNTTNSGRCRESFKSISASIQSRLG